ncbi:LysM peptidoglycan-binding domain-containing protein [Halomonas sp. WWR20]
MLPRSTYRQATSLAGGLLLALFSLPSAAGPNLSETPQSFKSFWSALDVQVAAYPDVWTRLKSGFTLPHDVQHPRVRKWLDWYRAHPQHVEDIAEQARPWLRWVVRRLEARGMPTEIALLPFIESAYDPHASHPGGATGLWQFMPGTGDALGLSRTWWYDGRRDVIAATEAALDYLQQQGDQWYEGDIELSLAAYNAGAGTVNRARQLAAKRGDPIDYWHLALPAQTMDYVPKLLALAAVIADPEHYGITLPEIADAPVFAKVETGGQMDLALAADLADVSLETLRELNPGFRRWATRPQNDPPLLVPADRRQAFMANLAKLPDDERLTWDRYVVRAGDTLSGIAANHNTPIQLLRRQNRLSGDMLRVGQALLIPVQPSQLASTQQDHRAMTIRVRAGDSLSRIAARHRVRIEDIARWNKLDVDKSLHPGQQLTLYVKN